jgi:hypothetical protein
MRFPIFQSEEFHCAFNAYRAAECSDRFYFFSASLMVLNLSKIRHELDARRKWASTSKKFLPLSLLPVALPPETRIV